MATHIGIGFSNHRDSQQAAKEAVLEAKTGLRTMQPSWALLLATGHYDPHQVISSANDLLRIPKIIGCSTTGIILSNSIETRGVAALIIASQEIQFGTGSVKDIDKKDPQTAGTELAKQCRDDFGEHGRQIFMFFIDSRLRNISPFLKSIQDTLGNIFPVVGAGSSIKAPVKDTFQFYKNQVMANAVSGVMMGGHMSVGVGNQNGWRPLGKPHIITEAAGNIIKSIDGKPAYNLYEEYFGQEAKNLRIHNSGQMDILYPLGIFIEESQSYLLRNAVDISSDGSIVCQGDILQEARIHLMIGNKDSCKQAAKTAAQEAHQNLLGKEPRLIIVLESLSRQRLLGRMAFQEIVKIKEVFGPKIPIIGMYSYGEISPLQSAERFKRPHLQNESITILAIS